VKRKLYWWPVLGAGALLALPFVAVAQQQPAGFMTVGQSGISPQFSLHLSETWNARFGMERFRHPWGLGGDDQGYNLAPDDGLGSAFVDWRPAGNGFRVSGGVLRSPELDTAVPDPDGSGFVGSLNLDVQAEPWQTAPYVGIGWDSAHRHSQPGWNFKLDLGVMFTGSESDSTTTSASGSETSSLSTTGATSEQLDDGSQFGFGLDEFGQYPVLSIGARYRW
jgi:hypothetical protein